MMLGLVAVTMHRIGGAAMSCSQPPGGGASRTRLGERGPFASVAWACLYADVGLLRRAWMEVRQVRGGTAMELTRRTFLGATGATGTGALLGFLGLNLRPSEAFAAQAKPQRGTISTTICPYCGVGCGGIVEVRDGTIVNMEGDPDHPINEGALCSKGASLYQLHHNERRNQIVRHRKPGAREWEELSWDQAIKMIAERVKKTREETWVGTDASGQVVNRVDGVACLGGASLDTEECYLLAKAMRAMGLVWIEHQARI